MKKSKSVQRKKFQKLDLNGIVRWMKGFCGNGIYPHEFLHELEQYGVRYNEKAKSLRTEEKTVKAPVYAASTYRMKVRQRGLGGKVRPGHWRGVGGLEMARALCRLVGVKPKKPSQNSWQGPFTKQERMFDACVKALLEKLNRTQVTDSK